MANYCSIDDNKAQVFYTDANGVKKNVLIEGQNPITVTIDSIGKKQFHSSGNALITYVAPGAITLVTCTGKFRQIGSDPSTELPCEYVLSHGSTSDNVFTSDYDSNYGDNTGDMTFTVNYVADVDFIRVRNSQGTLLFKDYGASPMTYEVKCIRQHCPEGYCECKADGYPGYCCNDCNDTASRIHALTEQVRGINGK
ncbi:hypothetical protein [Nostoc sp. C117]|uniref:hypothetical protein n=1 Tax=Nostoc sp. C117 TaxID=3349875 RepID=UPI00370DD6AE